MASLALGGARGRPVLPPGCASPPNARPTLGDANPVWAHGQRAPPQSRSAACRGPWPSPEASALGRAPPQAQGKASNSSSLLPFPGVEALATHPPAFMAIRKCPPMPITVSTSASVKPTCRALNLPFLALISQPRRCRGSGEQPGPLSFIWGDRQT